ncbi:hypothetical protein JL722_10817 [Aureococcus anophagefferens]|nr:hypothetical protein JL722_10817 [Aureococcus anophagefferens]
MTARSLVLLATWARAEWCAVQIANVFGDAPLSVEWRLDAAPDVVAAAAAAVVDELPASAWPAAVEAAVRSTMAAHRANGCAGSPAPRAAEGCAAYAVTYARHATVAEALAGPRVAYADAAVAAAPQGAAEAQLAVALKAALGARGGAVDTAPLGAPVVEGYDVSVRPGTTGFDHNEAWLVHLAAGADISRLAFNRHAFTFGADDGVLEVAPT